MNSAQPFSPVYRDRVSARVIEWATADQRIVGGAVVGSMATGPGDRWSDLDLTFAVADGSSVSQVLEEWTTKLAGTFSAIKLFDLLVGQSIYRVFLLPGCLQLDLSFTPAQEFGAIGPQFKLLFGEAVQKPFSPCPEPKTSSATPFITCSVPGFVLSAGDCFKPNIGSVQPATMPSISHAFSATSHPHMVAASTNSRRTSAIECLLL